MVKHKAAVRSRTIHREVVGRTASRATRAAPQSTVDSTVVNYSFYDKQRRGLAKGFEQAGVFGQIIAEILSSWSIGDSFQAQLRTKPADPENENDPINYTNDLISRFNRAITGELQQLTIDWYGLGDQYIVVNQADGSISIPSPDTVNAQYDPYDYRRLKKVVITSKTEEAGTVVDTYTETTRTIYYKRPKKYADENGVPEEETLEFDNLLGVVPVVHFAFGRGSNETHGHPVVEPLYPHFSRYDDLLVKMEDGAELMGNPIPVIEGAVNPAEVLALNGAVDPESEQYTDASGETKPRPTIDFDQLTGMILGEGGSFNFKSPAVGFTNDLRNTLKSIWILVMELSGIPEGHWGTEMGQSRSTTEEQTKGFEFRIRRYRQMLEGRGGDDLLMMTPRGGLLQLLWLWLSVRALTDSRVVVGEIDLQWPGLTERDDEQRLNWAKTMHDKGVITDQTFVSLSGLIEDPKGEVEAAKAEQEASADPFDQDVAANLASDEDEETETPDEELEPAA